MVLKTVVTLVESGISVHEAEASVIAEFLESSLQVKNGIVGFGNQPPLMLCYE